MQIIVRNNKFKREMPIIVLNEVTLIIINVQNISLYTC